MHNHPMNGDAQWRAFLHFIPQNGYIALGINLLQNIEMQLVMNCNQGAVIGFFSWLIKVNK